MSRVPVRDCPREPVPRLLAFSVLSSLGVEGADCILARKISIPLPSLSVSFGALSEARPYVQASKPRSVRALRRTETSSPSRSVWLGAISHRSNEGTREQDVAAFDPHARRAPFPDSKSNVGLSYSERAYDAMVGHRCTRQVPRKAARRSAPCCLAVWT